MLEFVQQYDTYQEGLTVVEVAKILNVTPESVRRYIRAKQLPAYSAGGTYTISKRDLLLYIQQSKTTKGLQL